MDFLKLKEPFFPDELEWKPQSVGKTSNRFWVRALAYVTNRAIMDRLDAVIGPEYWKNEYTKGPDGGILCGLSINVGTEWVTKWDGSENTDIEAVKGGLSGAMKRAAVQWGIGRYLYDLEETFGEVSEGGIYRAKTKEGEWFNWNPPKLPAWAIPGGGSQKKRQEQPPREALPADSSKIDQTKDWLNEHHAQLAGFPEQPGLCMAMLEGTPVALVEATADGLTVVRGFNL
jgi:hypothetical protein